jgi:hypothetical protein
LKVKADELRSLIGLSNPDDGDEVIGGKPEYTDAQTDEDVSAIPAPLSSRAKRDMSNQALRCRPVLTETAAVQFPRKRRRRLLFIKIILTSARAPLKKFPMVLILRSTGMSAKRKPRKPPGRNSRRQRRTIKPPPPRNRKRISHPKKLQNDIAAIEAQIKNTKGKKALAGLEAKKSDYQQLLDKKLSADEKKKLLKQQSALQKEFDSLHIKTYSGIWKDDVTTADWLAKSGGVQSKKDYFQNKLKDTGIAR